MAQILKIGVSGEKGSFSEEAARYYCLKNNFKKYRVVYLVSAENVLKNLTEGKIDKGIFPIENSNGGIVYEAVYAMAKYIFKIENLFEIDIRHYLLAKPGVKTSEVRKIISHQQALRQCRMYLKRRWPHIGLEEYCDTAQAAKDLSLGELPKNAAIIAPKICAKLYGLDILEENIQDLKFNFTTFVTAVK